jgi:antitoxin PrlF
MTKEKRQAGCAGVERACCKVEALVSVDERGQMVLPKDVRDRAGIRSGDKLALISMGGGVESCCLALVKVEAITGMVKDILGPLMSEIIKK